MAEYTPHQKKIIERYYDHRDEIMLTKLSEIVSELYLAETDGSKKRLWKRAGKAMTTLGVPAPLVEHVLTAGDVEVLARHVRRLGAKK